MNSYMHADYHVSKPLPQRPRVAQKPMPLNVDTIQASIGRVRVRKPLRVLTGLSASGKTLHVLNMHSLPYAYFFIPMIEDSTVPFRYVRRSYSDGFTDELELQGL